MNPRAKSEAGRLPEQNRIPLKESLRLHWRYPTHLFP